jgi:hypothetical protein
LNRQIKWKSSFIIVVLQSKRKLGDDSYDPYDWESEEEAEEAIERRKTRSSTKSASKPTSATEMETDKSGHDDTAAGPSIEPVTPAVIADDR